MPSVRALRASDEFAREVVGRIVRVGLASLGVLIVLAGIAVAPLPGPGGLPVIVVGLMLLLRNSFKARRTFVRFQHAHPKMVFPIRRLLRREPEILLVAWQQALRIERLIVPRKLRFAVKTRRRFRRHPS
ncbi:MAG: PGPGW domain-containing protein [Phenylobacterium sp.]|uniref:PGPGW domain-containing protein n=1 Tax=Phenylobacterium sp. TaxID=1871053 RepID=UPI003BB5DF46